MDEKRRAQKKAYRDSAKGKAAQAKAQAKYRKTPKYVEAQTRADGVWWSKPEQAAWLEWWNHPRRMRDVKTGRRILPIGLIQLEDDRIVPRPRLL